uniref:Uncharacterized protein n=1 Tax=Anguilla anguilla TaxID=7936 RepID=A0A0E9VAH1_ANGAN
MLKNQRSENIGPSTLNCILHVGTAVRMAGTACIRAHPLPLLCSYTQCVFKCMSPSLCWVRSEHR